jgi:hypothetical protein
MCSDIQLRFVFGSAHNRGLLTLKPYLMIGISIVFFGQWFWPEISREYSEALYYLLVSGDEGIYN